MAFLMAFLMGAINGILMGLYAVVQQSELCVLNRFLVCLSATQYLHAEIKQNFKI